MRAAGILWLIGAALLPVTANAAQIHSDMELSFDCERPQQVQNYAVKATFDGVLNGDRSASADLAIHGFALESVVHFDAQLGRGSRPAPGGSSQLRVVSAHALRGVWSLPNNDLIININADGPSCAVAVNFALKRGQREYSLWGGSKFYYCSAARVLRTSCTAR